MQTPGLCISGTGRINHWHPGRLPGSELLDVCQLNFDIERPFTDRLEKNLHHELCERGLLHHFMELLHAGAGLEDH